jgi:hypothetical protein
MAQFKMPEDSMKQFARVAGGGPLNKDFNEEDHPRDETGKFTDGGGGGSKTPGFVDTKVEDKIRADAKEHGTPKLTPSRADIQLVNAKYPDGYRNSYHLFDSIHAEPGGYTIKPEAVTQRDSDIKQYLGHFSTSLKG